MRTDPIVTDSERGFRGNANTSSLGNSSSIKVEPISSANLSSLRFPGKLRTQIPTFHSRTAAEAAERALIVKDRYATGELRYEVARMGVNPTWLSDLHHAPPYVAVSEQLMPLTTLFGKYGKYGKPASLRTAILHVGDIAKELSHISREPVQTGILASPNHLVARTGITSGFYLLLPNFGFLDNPIRKGLDANKLTKLRLISNKQLHSLEGITYQELNLSVGHLREIGESLIKECIKTERRVATWQAKYEKQHTFNHRSAEESRPMTRRMYEDERVFNRRARHEELTHQSLVRLSQIWEKCLHETCLSMSPTDSVSYWKFVSTFNHHISKAIVPEIPFENVSTSRIDNLATYGVSDWKKFLNALIENNLILEDEPILRYQTESGKHQTLIIKDLNSLTVGPAKSDIRYSIDKLVEESRLSFENEGKLRLLPIAMIRYWAMFMVGNGIALEDGMYYRKYERLYRASIEGTLTQNTRGLLVSPYTELTHYKPKDAENPYHDLLEDYSALDYLRLAAEQ